MSPQDAPGSWSVSVAPGSENPVGAGILRVARPQPRPGRTRRLLAGQYGRSHTSPLSRWRDLGIPWKTRSSRPRTPPSGQPTSKTFLLTMVLTSIQYPSSVACRRENKQVGMRRIQPCNEASQKHEQNTIEDSRCRGHESCRLRQQPLIDKKSESAGRRSSGHDPIDQCISRRRHLHIVV